MLAWIDRVIDEADNAKAAREWALEICFDLALKMVGTSRWCRGIYTSSWRACAGWSRGFAAGARGSGAEGDLDYRQGLAKAVIAPAQSHFPWRERLRRAGYWSRASPWRNRLVFEQRIFGLNMLLIALLNLGEYRPRSCGG